MKDIVRGRRPALRAMALPLALLASAGGAGCTSNGGGAGGASSSYAATSGAGGATGTGGAASSTGTTSGSMGGSGGSSTAAGTGGLGGTTTSSATASGATSSTTANGSSSTGSSSSSGTYPGPPAGGSTTSWPDCSVGVDPTRNGGDLLWVEVTQETLCTDQLLTGIGPTLKYLAVGPAGDIAVGVECRGVTVASPPNDNVAAYRRLNGSGALLLSGDYQVGGGDLVEIGYSGFSIAPSNDLVVSVGGCTGDCLNVSASSCSGASFEEQPAQGGAPIQGSVSCQAASAVNGYCCGPFTTQASTPSGQLVTLPPGIPDGAGGTYVVGALTTTLDVGCGPMVPTSSSNGYVAHLGAASACIFSHVLPAVPAAVADTHGVVLSASSAAGLDLGCGALAAVSGGSTFATRLDPSGSCVFGKSLPASGLIVALDPAGSAVVSGLVGATPFDLGGGPLGPLGSQDVVLGELDASGNELWCKRFGGPGITFKGPSVTVAAAGDVYLLTGWSGAVDLGGGAITAASSDTVVARWAPSGAYAWGRDFPIAGEYLARVDGCGSLVVASSDPAFDPGKGTLLPQIPVIPPPGSVPSDAIVRYAP